MRHLFLILLGFCVVSSFGQKPVFKNPGLTPKKHFTITDHIGKGQFVNADFDISLTEESGKKYYKVVIKEGNVYRNEIVMNFDDLTSVSEKRIDLKDNNLLENYIYKGNNEVYYFDRRKSIDKTFNPDDNNIYSRYAYFVSFQGFPFAIGNTVYFKTYMYEYGDALTMKLSCIEKLKVQVKAGSFDCYKLELKVAGWQAAFAPERYWLYFSKDAPHQFVRYEEEMKDGSWVTNELVDVD
jgi:hypothetical protein